MAGAPGVLRAGAEVSRTRPPDRLGLRRPVRPSAPRYQQRALPDPPRRPAQPWLPGALAVRAPSGARLAGPLRPRSVAGRDVRGPGALPGQRLPRRQLDRGRAQPRLRPRGVRLQRTRAAQAGIPFIPCPGPRGPGSGRPISTPARAMECRRRCRAPHRCDPFPRSSRTSTIPAAARAGAMPCPRCWHWPPPRRSAAYAATRRSANGSVTSAPRCCNAFACTAATGATGRPACRLSAASR